MNTHLPQKILILIVITLAGFAIGMLPAKFFHLLTLDGLKAEMAGLLAYTTAEPLISSALFFFAYIAVAALSLPGAAVMTLAAGALFGFAQGLLLASFASSIGAWLAFLASRYLLRDWVENRFGDRLKAINEGMARDGAFYLFTLRLVPAFPFFMINLLMGLTQLKSSTFYLVSQIGMLAGTAVYVNAGMHIAAINSISGILSPGLIASLTALGVFPLASKKIVALWQQKKRYARWQKPAQFDRNLIVIGAGAAGLVTSYIAAAVKAKVTLVEAHKMGGDCLNYGCVPSKALIKSARIAYQFRHADKYGLQAASPAFAFHKVMARVNRIIQAIEPHDSIERYTGLGVEVLQGHARLIDPWTVEITTADGSQQRLSSRSIVIATGAQPVVPPLPGIDETGYLTSDTLWQAFSQMDKLPQRIVVLGGGPIGCELAQALARLGSTVTQIERGERILSREDPEVSALARQSMAADGVSILTGHQANRCHKTSSGNVIWVEHNGQESSIGFDVLICAVGRQPRLEGYGLEALGIPVKHTVTTNEYLETLYPNIYAAGDIAGPYQFTHVAAHQAWYAAINALFGNIKRFKVDYRVIPWTTFTSPEVARVGLNEQEAREKNIAVEITRLPLDELDRAITDSTTEGFIKVLTVPGKDKILGVTIVGEHAGDLLAEYVLAMKWGLGLNKILSTIHTYPTLAEANKNVAGEWKRRHAPAWAYPWLERYHAWMRR